MQEAGHAAIPPLQAGDALVLVDLQNDFFLGGALPIARAETVVPVLNDWIEAAAAADLPVYASRDWHPPDHTSFINQGGPWPRHCVQDTFGAAFRDDVALPPRVIPVSKGSAFDRDAYSAFDGTGLAAELRQRGVRRLWIGGLALDVCVQATVLDALKAGFETHLIREGSRPVDERDGREAVTAMRQAGALLEPDAPES